MYSKADTILVEKQINAFLLLIALKRSGIDFIFKGGTSLILHFEELKRFSIDIDIQVGSHIDLIPSLESVIANSLFDRFEEDIRKAGSKLTKRHFKFYFNSNRQNSFGESYVLLDVVFGEYPFPIIEQRYLPAPFNDLYSEIDPLPINTPSTGGIIGDKLTAFAPRTVGIPFYRGGRSMSLEIVKQLFDLGYLFDLDFNADEMKKAFFQIAESVIHDRELSIDVEEVIADSIGLCFDISTRNQNSKEFVEVLAGIRRFVNFLPDRRFNIIDAIRSSAKVAYLLMLLKNGSLEIARFNNDTNIDGLSIQVMDYSKLNKLKKIDPQAFFYWYKALDLK
ncbi:MAG: hypothetical protein HBSAPP04_21010 [Ignavibacteriaceae bacterium]|nr:MAG: hypothetical protein HBSAPP04_21010 [Ignavibacteriaceae bacterium]